MNNTELILLMLRLVAAASLLLFLGLLVYYIRRDMLNQIDKVHKKNLVRGQLVSLIDHSIKHPIVTPLTLGRAVHNSIQVEDTTVSNVHACVVERLGQLWLEDQQSRNGTELNGILIDEPIVLSSGDVIGVGNAQFRVELTH